MRLNKVVYSCIFLSLFACSNNEVVENVKSTYTEESDGIIEYDLNEDRIDAVQFNNNLSMIQQNVSRQIELLFQSDSIDIQQNYENTLFEIEINLHELKSYEVENGENFLKAITDLLIFYKNELTNDFPELIEIIKSGVKNENELERLNEYDVKFAKEEAEYLEIIFQEQDTFAAINNIKLAS
ncbi:hypothetical protein [Crocinitomix catalasitica]|uniref:hypothetical protein n=1 Tax=Crocinitomix catalasitica TaxID=184607 RepID=UPI0004825F71|nr:hypothetical protein [Crocinitomix catalasitica]